MGIEPHVSTYPGEEIDLVREDGEQGDNDEVHHVLLQI